MSLARILLPASLALLGVAAHAQIDSSLLVSPDTIVRRGTMNMDAVRNRPMVRAGRLPVNVGGYVEAKAEHLGTDGVSEGTSFAMQRLTVFLSSSISERVSFMSEIEFEEGTEEIGIEFASIDVEFSPLVNFRGGVVMNPIGAFNQNHDGPRWEFVDRPLSATQLLPATWSNVGFGFYGRKRVGGSTIGYEAYLTNGFDGTIVDNAEGRTFLPAAKADPGRFGESSNGVPLFTGKLALARTGYGELGLSYMGGVYNKFEDDGLTLDQRRRVDVFAVDANATLKPTGTTFTGEFAWVRVDVPDTYSQQYGSSQRGGFLDVVQPIRKGEMLGFHEATLNIAVRFEYVDWNVGSFRETGTDIGDEVRGIVPGISFRPGPLTVFRLNYRHQRQRDLFGNAPALTGGFQIGLSSYF